MSTPTRPDRRGLLALVLALPMPLPWTLAGCGTSPPIRLYRLPTESPQVVPPAGAASGAVHLLLPVRVPEYLDRETILMPQGASGLQALAGHRWAESLRDAVPRVLRADLAAHLGEGRVWTAPLPAGLVPARQLRVELLALEIDAERAGVLLQARWSWIDPHGQTEPRAAAVRLHVAAPSGGIDELVDAHRLALWQLAGRIASAP